MKRLSRYKKRKTDFLDTSKIQNIKSSLAQLVERETVNLEAAGSTPAGRDVVLFLDQPK
jgi:hypothetical protein